VKKFLNFIAVGTFFSTIEEFLTVVVLRGDIPAYFFTLLVLFPIFLTFVYFSSRLLDSFLGDQPRRELAHYFIYGFLGVMIEWFLIGLSPWSDPNANPMIMLVFQLGMFSFWGTVAFAPRLFNNMNELSKAIRSSILGFYIPYFVIVYLVGFIIPGQFKFPVIISLIIFAYLFLNLFYLKYFGRLFKLKP
jgi:hypothetical protein